MQPATPHPVILPFAAPQRGHANAIRALVGIDGGGTHTRVRVLDVHDRFHGEGDTGASALNQGVEQAWRNIDAAFQQAARAAGQPALQWHECAVGAGLSGANVGSYLQSFVAAHPGCARLVVDSDAYTGVIGAHAGAPGALLISGTGSICAAVRRDGTRRSVGGWGWTIGDEGSGAWLGKEALRHAQRVLDGRDPAGALAKAIWQRVGSGDDLADALREWSARASQAALASLGPIVFEQADHDPIAAQLLDQAAAELHALACAADPDGELAFAIAGSVAVRLQHRFPEALRRRVAAPIGDAVSGALQLARRALSDGELH